MSAILYSNLKPDPQKAKLPIECRPPICLPASPVIIYALVSHLNSLLFASPPTPKVSCSGGTVCRSDGCEIGASKALVGLPAAR